MSSPTTPFLSKIDEAEAFTDADLEDGPDPDQKHHQALPHRQTTKRRHYLRIAWRTSTFLLAAWGLTSLSLHIFYLLFPKLQPSSPDVYRPITLPPGLNECDCGTTIEEALSRDCIYDSLSTGWLPPHCRDDPLTAEFDHAGPGPGGEWSYFADEAGTTLLSKSDLALLGGSGGSFWAHRDWHIAHCLYYWQKFMRLRETGVVLEARFDGIKHVRHCTRLIRAPTPEYFFLIEVPVRMNGSVDMRTTSTKISGMVGDIAGHGHEHGGHDGHEEEHGGHEGHQHEHEE